MKKILIKLIVLFIPVKSWRKKIRNKFKDNLFLNRLSDKDSIIDSKVIYDHLKKKNYKKAFSNDIAYKYNVNIHYNELTFYFGNILFKNITKNMNDLKSTLIQWGGTFSTKTEKYKDNMLLMEDSFIKSISTVYDTSASKKDKMSVSCVIDDLNYHWNCYYPNRLEMQLNSDFELSENQSVRSKEVMSLIKENHITKYNFQPIYRPEIGRKNAKKVLVLDQSYGDQAIYWSNSSEQSFEDMLKAAVTENPDADIIIKVHPDALVDGPKKGFYTKSNTIDKYLENDNIHLFADAINPVSILSYVDKVYVMSSGMGLEALICGKETVTFGCPFYAGWGLTDDRNPIINTDEIKNRRSKKRSLEDMFFLSYIWYSIYINPVTNEKCEIEDSIDWLLKERSKYFETNKVKN